MRLFLLGATGRTGAHALDLARAHGHEVTAFVRTPGKIAPVSGVKVVVGDPRTGDRLAAALAGHDAVLCALGAHARDALRPGTLMTELGASVVRAMTEARVPRGVFLSAALLFPEKGALFTVVRWVLRHHVRDLEAMEATIRASDLAWTMVRPPRLVQAQDEKRRVQTSALPAGGMTVSFRAVAATMLETLERGEHVREIVGVAR